MVQIAPIEGLAHVIGDTSRRLLDVTLPEFFDYTLRKYGHCEAVVFSQFGIRWTYAELLKNAMTLRRGFWHLVFTRVIGWVFGHQIAPNGSSRR